MSKKIMIVLAVIVLISAGFVLIGRTEKQSFAAEGTEADAVISNNDEVIGSVRQSLKERCKKISISFRYDQDIHTELLRFASEWMDAALEETDDPACGDYIRYQYGGYRSAYSFEKDGSGYSYLVEIEPRFYCYPSQEEKATQAFEDIMASLELESPGSDFEKIKAVYDYICCNVRYNSIAAKNAVSYLRSTSYAALIRHTATCQGYCVCIYRMLRSCGIDCRIVRGTSGKEDGGLHAWNIVKLDGKWYCLDATWDAGKESYDYFLKGQSFFQDHQPSEEFSGRDFTDKYPVNMDDYIY